MPARSASRCGSARRPRWWLRYARNFKKMVRRGRRESRGRSGKLRAPRRLRAVARPVGVRSAVSETGEQMFLTKRRGRGMIFVADTRLLYLCNIVIEGVRV